MVLDNPCYHLFPSEHSLSYHHQLRLWSYIEIFNQSGKKLNFWSMALNLKWWIKRKHISRFQNPEIDLENDEDGIVTRKTNMVLAQWCLVRMTRWCKVRTEVGPTWLEVGIGYSGGGMTMGLDLVGGWVYQS